MLLGKFKIYTLKQIGELWMICRPHTQFLVALVSLQPADLSLCVVRSPTFRDRRAGAQQVTGTAGFSQEPEHYKNYTCGILEFGNSIENNGKHRYCI